MAFNPDLFGINIGQEFQSGFNSSFPGYINNETLSQETLDQFIADIRYKKSVFGFKRFRFAMPDYSWAARLTFHRQLLTALAQEGNVHIEYGIAPLSTFNSWRTWIDNLDTHVQWFQTLINTYASNGVTGKWILHNEAEFNNTASTPVSMVRASNVVTVTMASNHWLDNGFWITVNNSSLVSAGPYAVTSTPTETSFTFASTGTDGSTSNNGAITWALRGQRQFLKKLATHLKTLTNPAITMPLVVSCAQGEEAPGVYWYFEPYAVGTGSFPYVGQGDIDEIHLNVYSVSNANLETNWNRFKAEVDDAYALFGSNFTISEWNNYEDDTTARVPNNDLAKRDELLKRRKDLVEGYGMKHYYFAWRMPSKLAEKYPAYNNIGGGIRPSLFKLTEKPSPFIEIIPQ